MVFFENDSALSNQATQTPRFAEYGHGRRAAAAQIDRSKRLVQAAGSRPWPGDRLAVSDTVGLFLLGPSLRPASASPVRAAHPVVHLHPGHGKSRRRFFLFVTPLIIALQTGHALLPLFQISTAMTNPGQGASQVFYVGPFPVHVLGKAQAALAEN